MFQKIKTSGVFFLSLISASLAFAVTSFQRPNVLFIAVDDLRPELGCYGNAKIQSPNIDRLASSGTVFERAYCQVPVCGASRASLMTGIYPTSKRFLSYHTKADEEVRGIYDIPGWFKENGYTTISNGKIYHQSKDFLRSWDELNHPGSFRRYLLPENIALPNNEQPPFERLEVSDDAYPDGEIANQVIENLERAKAEGTPFFIAAGFSKPHLPFNAPSKYWDLYAADSFQLPDNYYLPEDAPREAIHQWNELRGQYGMIPQEGSVSDAMALKLIHGYYASVSYADAMIGKVLNALDRLGMRENTIIVLWGDHGWQLGEHTLWCKHALFKTSLHAPLIISSPNYNTGQKTNSLVEFVDIYPTLCALAGIDAPTHLQGRSLVKLMEEPEARFKSAVYSRYHSGEAVKTNNLSYAEWRSGARMLYDHNRDPDENVNRVNDPKYAPIVEKISALLYKHRQRVDEADAAYANSIESSEMLEKNGAPVWGSSKFHQKPAIVGEAYSTYVNFRVNDPEEDGLTYARLEGPAWLRLTNPRYGRFEGTPQASDAGVNTFKVSVSDGINEPVVATMQVIVK